MSLKITVDEDLPRQAVHLLREHGYDAASVVELISGRTYREHIGAFCFYALMKMEFDPFWNC